MSAVTFRMMTPEDAAAVSQLVTQVFDAAIAPLYSPEGVREFHAYAAPEAIQERAGANHFVALAESDSMLAGVAEVRDNSHLAMFFIAEGFQRIGLGRELLSRVVATCLMSKPELESMTVHASPNSIGAYERLGFVATGPEETVNGIRLTPMVLHLETEASEDFETPWT